MRGAMADSTDWEIDSNGLYVASRSFLMRRGYCCANQCRNCPYINWRNSPLWRPLEASMVQVAKVSSKARDAAGKALAQHELQVQHESQSQEAFHQEMIAHYRLLLKRWEEPSR